EVEARGQAGNPRGRRTHATAPRLMLQVVAGGEGALAGAGDDGHPLVLVGGEVVEDLVELEVRRRMQRVHHLRPVQRDGGDGAVLLDGDEFVGHGAWVLRVWRRCCALDLVAGNPRAWLSDEAHLKRKPP